MITVTAAILMENGLILAAKRRTGLHLEGLWEFPGGKLEEGEQPEQCLKRELFEEFGIETKIGRFIGESVYQYTEKRIRLLGFLAYHIDGEFTLTDHDEIRWLAPEQLHTLQWAPADLPMLDALLDYLAGNKN